MTFTSYGRVDQVQIFLLLKLNFKLLLMPSDAAGFSAHEDFENAPLPPCFLLQQSPQAGPSLYCVWPRLTSCSTRPEWIQLPIIWWVPNTQTRNPNAFPGPSFLCSLTGIYFLKWNGQYLGVCIIHKTERGKKNPSCILLFYFVGGKMFYAGPSESKTHSYYSTHSCFNHFFTNDAEKMWFSKQTGRKSLNTPWERV